MKKKPYINFKRTEEDNFMRDLGNFLRNNNISLYNEDGTFKEVKDILKEANLKFENS